MTAEQDPPAQGQLGVTALAAMARALSRPLPLFGVLELAAEEACDALHAASVSISEVEAESGRTRTIINVGILGPGETRWPYDETYSIDEVSKLSRLVKDLVPWTADIADPACDPFEAELLRSLDKGSAMAAPILVDGGIWGEMYLTRHRGRHPFDGGDVAYVEVLMAVVGGAISRSLRDERAADAS